MEYFIAKGPIIPHYLSRQIGVIVVIFLPSPVPYVGPESPARGQVGIPAVPQVPLAHGVRGVVQTGGKVLGHEGKASGYTARARSANYTVLHTWK